MKHYVQYHNTDKQGGRPELGRGEYRIFSSKSLRHLPGNRVWLISGEGKSPKSYFLEYTFVVDAIGAGKTNVARGRDGFRFDPPIPLNGLAWFKHFQVSQQNFSLGLREIDEPTVIEFERLAAAFSDPQAMAEAKLARMSVAEVLRAFRAIEGKFSAAQKEMLVGHANARGNAMSMGRLAELAGYDSFNTANLHYGKIGARMAEALAITGFAQSTMVLAVAAEERDEHGHWQWKMRPVVLAALRGLWPDLVAPLSEDDAAVEDVIADPKCKGLKATTQAALIMARIGQGEYRKKLLKLWRGQCAVTGCDIETVLVASHAKPWRDSTNEERLDPYNGLLLAASVDRLFDKGLIAFHDDGRIIVADTLSDAQLARVGLARNARLSRVDKAHVPYLAAHRKEIYSGK
jgi:putative restriction endonuclease